MPRTEKQKFVDERLRPLCESMRADEARIQAMRIEWLAGKKDLFVDDDTPYIDGRDGEGLSPMVESDIFAAAKVLLGAVATDNAGRTVYSKEAISKPTVQAIEVT